MYRYYFKKEKYIFTNLNKCKLHDNFLDGEVWIPAKKFEVNFTIYLASSISYARNYKTERI